MTRVTAQMRLRNHKRLIQREYPYQVALPDFMCCRENYSQIATFCAQHGLEFMTTSVIAKWPNRKELEFRLHCFRAREAAEMFNTYFDGVRFDPLKNREAGKLTGALIRTDEWKEIERCGSLKVPRFLRENP